MEITKPAEASTCRLGVRFSFKGHREHSLEFRWTPHPVIVTIRDNQDIVRVLVYSHYATPPRLEVS